MRVLGKMPVFSVKDEIRYHKHAKHLELLNNDLQDTPKTQDSQGFEG